MVTDKVEPSIGYPLSGKDIDGSKLRIPGKGWEPGRNIVLKVTFRSSSEVFTKTILTHADDKGNFLGCFDRSGEIPVDVSFSLHIIAAYQKGNDIDCSSNAIVTIPFSFRS